MQKITPHNVRVFKWLNSLHGIRFYTPIAILYFAQITGSYALAATVMSAAFITQAVMEVPTGILSDKIGRRNTAFVGSVSYLASIILYAIGLNFWWLIAAAVCGGIMQALYSGNNDSLLYESSKQDGDPDYHAYFGKTETYFHLAAGLSALLGGIVAVSSFKLVYAISIVPAIGMVLAALFFIEPSVQRKKERAHTHLWESLKYLGRSSKLRIMTLAGSIEFGVGHALFGLSASFTSTVWPLWALGISQGLASIWATIGFAISGKVVTRFRALKTAVLSSTWSISLNIIALSISNVVSPILMSLGSLSFGTGTVAKNSLFHEEFNDAQRATLGSITSLAGSLVFAVASIGVGILADTVGPAKGLLIGQIPLVIAMLLFLRLRHK